LALRFQHLAFCALTLAACGREQARTPPASAPRHVILISIDTLRADHVGAYGYPKPTTPFLDSLAKEGVLFEQHMSNSNNTLSSHASILSGLVPMAHGTRDGGSDETRLPLPSAVDTLAERMNDAGYTTAAFTAHAAWLGRAFGLDQGFEHLEAEWWNAKDLSRAFLHWLDAETPSHMFAFLHFYDAHSDMAAPGITLPYQSDPEFVARIAGTRPANFTGTVPGKDYQCCSRWLMAANKGVFTIPPEQLEYVRGLYDAGIAQLDRDLWLLFGELRRRGYLDGALIVVTSDHGEEFWEHGQMMHGGMHEEISRVPLIIVPPRGTSVKLRTISSVTRSIDIAATISDFAGGPSVGSGRSLKSAFVDGAALEDGEVMFLESVLRSRDAQGAFRYVEDPVHPQLWDLRVDPGELNELLAHDPNQATLARAKAAHERLTELRDAAREFEAQLRAKSTSGPAKLSSEEEDRLKSLGYGGGH
jgi:arylsulfatase A-like enzyme